MFSSERANLYRPGERRFQRQQRISIYKMRFRVVYLVIFFNLRTKF